MYGGMGEFFSITYQFSSFVLPFLCLYTYLLFSSPFISYPSLFFVIPLVKHITFKGYADL